MMLRANLQRLVLIGVVSLLLSACRGGAVVFAPTPAPPDLSPLQYQHPGGAFSARVPRQWSVYERNTTTLATASFAPPNEHVPLVSFAVVRLPDVPLNGPAINTLLNDYQTRIRPDAQRYQEQNREAMGDGSWRMTGLRQISGGTSQPINTFIQFEGDLIGVIEVIVADDHIDDVQSMINTLTLNTDVALEVTEIDTLAFANSGRLEPLNIHTWTSPDGVFFVTGEVANYADVTMVGVPVQVDLFTADGRVVAQATDTVMGYGIPPGGFAPFSLRFGQGQPPLTAGYELSFGSENWTNDESQTIYHQNVLRWRDESLLTADGRFIVTGEITNPTSDIFVYLPRLTVTVFDENQLVIAAAFRDLEDVEIAPGEVVNFEIVMTELGGIPNRYIVDVQGKP